VGKNVLAGIGSVDGSFAGLRMTEGIEPGVIELVAGVDADGALLVFCVFRGDQIRDWLGDAAPQPSSSGTSQSGATTKHTKYTK
jgi:hypothetical protein